MTVPEDLFAPVRGLKLHVRRWRGERTPFLLLHGLASNCMTWEVVAGHLNAAGHEVASVDQRGHGLSHKPDDGYSFEEVTADLRELTHALDLQRPVLAGQSWGGNVVLDYLARYPGEASGAALVDGGFIELASRPGATWESISVELRPPNLIGTPRAELSARLRASHPEWSDEGVEHTLANFETVADGTVRPWLTLDRHMQILRCLWEHRPSTLYPLVGDPVLIAPAASAEDERTRRKREAVRQAGTVLAACRVHWFEATDHDIHVHRPAELASVLLDAAREGFFEGSRLHS